MTGVFACCLLTAVVWADTPQTRAEAAKLNNLGVAYMNQQLMEKATAKFDEAYKPDPALATASLNKGIALLNQQRLPEAEADRVWLDPTARTDWAACRKSQAASDCLGRCIRVCPAGRAKEAPSPVGQIA